MPTRPRLLLFDLDGVLADYQREIRCRELAETLGASEAEVHRAIFDRGFEERCDRGELALADYLDALRVDYGWNLPEQDFILARSAATRTRAPMLALSQQLADQTALGIFTNNGVWVGEHAHRIVPELTPLFGRRFVCSGNLGVCKPAPEAFVACLQRLGFSPASTLYVDDRVEKVEGAQAAGLEAVHFESLPQFIVALNDYQFDTADHGSVAGENLLNPMRE